MANEKVITGSGAASITARHPDVDRRITVALDAACELRTLIQAADSLEEMDAAVIYTLLRRAKNLADGVICALDDEVSKPSAIEARLWRGAH